MATTALLAKFEHVEEDWTGLSDQKKRKVLQNRINQRAHRTRKLRAQLATQLQLPPTGKATSPVRDSKSAGIRLAWDIDHPIWPFPNTSLSALEWDILFYARDKLWFRPCDPTLWGHRNPDAVCRALVDLSCARLIETPIMRHSIILATCFDLEYLSGRDYTAIKLRHANAAISQILLGLKAYGGSKAISQIGNSDAGPAPLKEDILFAVMALAKQSCSTSINPLPGTFGSFKPLFPIGPQFLNLFGQHDTDLMHCGAMQELIETNDGCPLESTCTPGFGDALAQFNLLECAKSLSPPFLNIPTVRLELLGDEVAALKRDRDARESFTHAIPRLFSYATLLEVARDIRFYCAWFNAMRDELEKGPLREEQPRSRPLGILAHLSDSIEHRLLSYKFLDTSVEERLCWTTSLIFVHCVIYPLPSRRPLDILLGRLQAILRACEISGDGDVSETFYSWASMIAALACHTSDEARRQWFLERLRVYAAKVGISSWEQMKTLLEGFFWLEGACDVGGLALWDRVPKVPARLDLMASNEITATENEETGRRDTDMAGVRRMLV